MEEILIERPNHLNVDYAEKFRLESQDRRILKELRKISDSRMIVILAFIALGSLHATRGFDGREEHHPGFVERHSHVRLRDVKETGPITFSLPPQRFADVQTNGRPRFVSEYKNYTNATVTTDTNICSKIGV